MTAGRPVRGFSLLEMLVAISILGITLGVLYQAIGGATRNIRIGEKYAYGVELARSLLAENARVPRAGANRSGETAGGFIWQVASNPVGGYKDKAINRALHRIEVTVAWQDGPKRRQVVLHSVVEAMSL